MYACMHAQRRRKHLSRLIIDYENTCIDMWVKKDAARLDPEDQEKLEWTKHLKQLSGMPTTHACTSTD